LAKLRDELVFQHQELLRNYVEFFESVQRLEDLHRLTLSMLSRIRGDASLSALFLFQFSTLFALFKGPKRVAISIFLRRMPKLRNYIINVRQLVYGGH